MLHFLSREERYEHDRQCDDVLSDAMAAMMAYDGRVDAREWRVIGRRDQLTVYRAAHAAAAAPKGGGSGSGSSSGSARTNVLATGFVRGSLAQISEGLSAETDEELLATEALLSGAHVSLAAAAVLNVGERSSARARFRFAGVKWYAWTRRSAASRGKDADVSAKETEEEQEEQEAHEEQGGKGDGPLNNKDEEQRRKRQHQHHHQPPQQQELLAYERMGMMVDDEGREVAYHVVRSMDRPEWPLFVARAPGLQRADVALCFLFRAVCDDLVECLVAGSFLARASSAAQRAAEVTVAERVLAASRSLRSYEAKKLARLMDKLRDRPPNMSKNCLRCGARRTVLDPLRNCGLCKKSVCSSCRQSKRILKLNTNLMVPETEAFCCVCLERARLPSVVSKSGAADVKKTKMKTPSKLPEALRRERASLPATLDYQNYDRLLEGYAKRRRPRASSASPASSSMRSVESNESRDSSSSEDLGSGRGSLALAGRPLPPAPASPALPDRQLLELRRARDTLLSLPVARTVVQEDLYLPPCDAANSAASSQAEAAFLRHREREQQLEALARPNPLHLRLLEEQERRRRRARRRKEPQPEPTADVGRRPAKARDPETQNAPDAQSEQAAAAGTPWAADAFRSDLYARF